MAEKRNRASSLNCLERVFGTIQTSLPMPSFCQKFVPTLNFDNLDRKAEANE